MTVVFSEEELVEYVREQRWFAAKTQDLIGIGLIDHAVLRRRPRVVDALAELRYGSGMRDLYQLLLGDGPVDVLGEQAVATELVRRVRTGATVAGAEGRVGFEPFGDLPRRTPLASARLLGVEQSNSSVIVDDTLFVKVYRRIEAGENPDLEMTRFLVSHGFENIPDLWGWWSYSGPPVEATFGIVQRYVPGSVDGWTLALDELRSRPDEFAGRTRRLGEVVGRMHCVLASDAADPSFASEDTGTAWLPLVTATMDEEIEQVFLHLPDDNEAVAPLAGRGDAVRDLMRELSSGGTFGRRIRLHGDLHLGQVLWADGDWLVIDFEGEPARPLPARRIKRSPLRDVAGMLRSFAYAAIVAGVAGSEVEERSRQAFLDGYLQEAGSSLLLPGPEAIVRALHLFELEKAVYELRYELSNRPDWVHIPVEGILRLLQEA